MLDSKTASIVATSIVHSKLDYCNSLFLNLDSTQIQRLQLIQNSLVRAVTRTPRHHHITSVLTCKSLHWPKIPERIHFKVLSLTYNSLQSSQATYLRELFTIQPTQSTLSSSCLTISRPPGTSYLIFSKRAISNTAPRLWKMTNNLNSAPFLYLHHRHCQSQDIIFIRLLYPSPSGPSTQN